MSSELGMLLLAVVAGYWALERAASHRGQLQKVGQVVGVIVIVVSLLGVAWKVKVVSGKVGHSRTGGWHHAMPSKVPGAETP